MGFFGSLFGKKEDYPELEPGSRPAEQISRFESQLSELMNKIHDRIEVIPAEGNVYVYVGKPPGMFGMVWFEDGREVNFKSLMKDKGLSQKKVQMLSGKLGDVYAGSTDFPRYSAKISGRTVIVTPSETFENAIAQVLNNVNG